MYSFISEIIVFSGIWAKEIWPVIYQSALLACLIFLITRHRKISASIRFGLWLLVPLRMLVMPIATVTLPVLPADVAEPVYFEQAFDYSIDESFSDEITLNTNITAAPFSESQSEISASKKQVNDGKVIKLRSGLYTILFGLWILGVLIVSLRTILGWFRINSIINKGTLIEDQKIIRLARNAAQSIGLTRLPAVISTGEDISSFVHGIFRPVVVLPQILIERLSQEQLLALFVHEFTHLKRRDPLIGWIVTICQVFYFFHPGYYLARYYILLDREMACDDRVISVKGQRKSVYAQALVNAGDACRNFNFQFAPKAVATDSYSHLRKRLFHLANKLDNPGRMSIQAIVILIFMGIIGIPGISLTSRALAPDNKIDQKVTKNLDIISVELSDIKHYEDFEQNHEPDRSESTVVFEPEAEKLKNPSNENKTIQEDTSKNTAKKIANKVVVVAEADNNTEKIPEKQIESNSVQLTDETGMKNDIEDNIVSPRKVSDLKETSGHTTVPVISPTETEDAGAYMDRGSARYEDGKFDEAISYFSKAIALNSDNAVAYYSRGNAYFKARQIEKAICDYDRAIEINPGYTYAYAQRGYIYESIKGEYDRAISDLSKAIELNPDLFSAYVERGHTYEAQNKYKKARSDYKRAIKLNPKAAYLKKSILRVERSKNIKKRYFIQDFDENAGKYERPQRTIQEMLGDNSILQNLLREHGINGHAAF